MIAGDPTDLVRFRSENPDLFDTLNRHRSGENAGALNQYLDQVEAGYYDNEFGFSPEERALDLIATQRPKEDGFFPSFLSIATGAARVVIELSPLAIVVDGYELYQAVREGDALGIVLAGVQFVPFVGNGAAKFLKSTGLGQGILDAALRGSKHALEKVAKAAAKLRGKKATNRTVDPAEVSFSQATVSPRTTDGLTIDELAASMRQNGWQGRPLDVISRDGVPTSMDNRRLLAARRAGIDVPVTVRNAGDPLTASQVRDFTVTGRRAPTTWDEAMDLRIGRQGEMRGAPSDWAERFPNGSIYDPDIVE